MFAAFKGWPAYHHKDMNDPKYEVDPMAFVNIAKEMLTEKQYSYNLKMK